MKWIKNFVNKVNKLNFEEKIRMVYTAQII